MKLTKAAVEALKPRFSKKTGKLTSYRVSDGRCLYLTVSPTMAKSWVLMWELNGKQHELGLGSYTGTGSVVAVSIDQARRAADKARLAIQAAKDGVPGAVNPVEAKRTAKTASVTFRTLMEDYIENVVKARSTTDRAREHNVNQWRNSLTTHAASILDMQVTKITVDHVREVVLPIWATRKVGERVRSRIEEVLGVAKANKTVPENVAVFKDNLGKMLAPKPKKTDGKKHASLSYRKLAPVVAELTRRKGMSAKALLNAILSGGRTDETLSMQHSELDLDAAVWNIPADRMKANKAHTVMLSTQHVAMLRDIEKVEGSTFVFNAPKGGKLSPAALRDMLNKPEKKGGLGVSNKDAVPHGFRRTFINWAGDNGFSEEIAEMAVAHAVTGVRGHYRDRPVEEVLAELTQAYADFAFGIENKNVLPFARRAA